MFFSWLKKRRRRKWLAQPFPEAWLEHLRQHVALYALLSESDQAKLRNLMRIFIPEKSWEGCGGLTVTEEMQVAVAAQACLLILGMEHDYFSHVQTILVYPNAYRSPEGVVGPDGVVYLDHGIFGEAWHRGPVILSWEAVRTGGQNRHDGRNLVLHEFAHQLDFLDGFADGVPPLQSPAHNERWHRVLAAEYLRLVQEAERGKPKVLDEYGATNPAEFFAVATECFFEKPRQMQKRHEELYGLLKEYYGQDPGKRLPDDSHHKPTTI